MQRNTGNLHLTKFLAYLAAVVVDYGVLVVGVLLEEPGPEIALVLVLLGLGLLPVLGDVEVGVEVGEEVDLEGVLLVEDVVVGVLDHVDGDLVGGELEEHVALRLLVGVHRVVLVHHLAELEGNKGKFRNN